VIEQYRDELVMSLQGNLDEQQVAEDREVVARDLLNILHRFTFFRYFNHSEIPHDFAQYSYTIYCHKRAKFGS